MPAVDPVIIELRLRAERAERDLQRFETRVGGAASRISGLLAGISLVALAREFLSLADTSKQLEAQLRLATQAFGTFGQAQADVQRIAAVTRGSLEATTSLYGNLIRATQSLGGTQDQAARATETFSKALKLGGGDANAAASATLQFGQALASGALRGDEFNSIAEASPRLLRLIAEAVGVPQGALRKLAEEGKLTSDVLFKALTDKRFTAGIDAEFQTLPVTFDEAMGQVKNAAITTFGAFDRGGDFSTALANFITDGSNGFVDLAREAEKMGSDARGSIEGLADAFQPVLDTGIAIFDALGIRVEQFGKDGRQAISELLGALDEAADLFNKGRGFLGGDPKSYKVFGVETVGPGLRDQFDKTSAASDRARALSRVVRNGNTRLREDILRPASRPDPRPAASAGGKKGPKGPSAETLAKRAEADRLRELRDDESFANEKASLNADILRARQSIATAADVIAQYELEEIETARARQNTSYQADVAQKRLTQARANELIALNDKVAVERAALVNAREAERKRADAAFVAEGDLTNSLDLLNAQGQLADTAKERREIALRILDAELAIEKARLEEVIASRQSSEAEKQRARNRLAALPGIANAERENVERQNEGSLARFRRRLNDPATDVEDAVAQKLQDVDDAIADAAAKTLGIKDPFLKRLLQIFLEQNVLKPLYDAASKSGGGGGTFGAIIQAAGSLFGRASGGYVGPGQTVRVNEQRGSGVELLRMGSQSGTVIPLGQANASARQAPTAVYQTFVLDNRGGITTPELINQMNGLARQAAIEGAAGGRALAAQDMRNANRPRI